MDGKVNLKVPEGYKFLDKEQSNYVLTELWGNPPSEVLGLLFPDNMTPLSRNFSYAVEISYSEEGFIEDKDARSLDYEELLQEMQKETREGNAERATEGYEPIELVGWASKPFYDTSEKKLHWAKELKFGEDEINTLNYNIRILGRQGYLNLNAIGTMDVLPEFQANADEIMASVSFQDGYQYSDFKPGVDKVATYGIGGLIAGKVLTKVGFFAMLAKFWKVIVLAGVSLVAALRKVVFGKKEVA